MTPYVSPGPPSPVNNERSLRCKAHAGKLLGQQLNSLIGSSYI